MEKNSTRVGIKLWLKSETGETLFGEGQIRILEAIEENGSINSAAKSLGMGYRSMWGRLKKIEKRIGKVLLIRQKGGASGGQSTLTPAAVRMIQDFRKLQCRIRDASEKIHADIYSSGNE